MEMGKYWSASYLVPDFSRWAMFNSKDNPEHSHRKIDVDCSQSGSEEAEIMKKTLFVHININTMKGKIL